MNENLNVYLTLLFYQKYKELNQFAIVRYLGVAPKIRPFIMDSPSYSNMLSKTTSQRKKLVTKFDHLKNSLF